MPPSSLGALAEKPVAFLDSLLDSSLDDFVRMLQPDRKVVDPERLIVDFPEYHIPSEPVYHQHGARLDRIAEGAR